IFAQRAKTKEAELQIRLAQAEYMLPRIRRLWTHLDRQRGGVGLRAGEGEKQIEIDRRILKREIAQLKSELAKVRRQRAQQRKQRQRVPVPVASLVGYTNAGKSSLLNHLTRAEVLVENKLFATLDPTTRRLELPSGQTLLLTDTVGFIRNLPHSLVEAFKATLEEAVQADFLIHVVDVSSTQWREHIEVTADVLREIGAGEHLRLLVFNKIDLIDSHQLRRLRREYQDAVFVSVKTGEGIEELKQELAAILQRDLETVQLTISHERSDLVARIHEQAVVTQIRYEDHHIFIEARVPQKMKKELQPFIGAATYSL
ncbi:MAG: GTPase HflX, partial [Lentisphaerae bacterium]